jgi:predicted DNA-binding transcriptional regulator AlpA
MPADLPALVDRPTAARLLSVKQSTLRRWWTRGVGPRGVKLSTARSGRVMYPTSEIEAYARDPLSYERSARPDSIPTYDPPQRRGGRQHGR